MQDIEHYLFVKLNDILQAAHIIFGQFECKSALIEKLKGYKQYMDLKVNESNHHKQANNTR